MRFLYTIRQYLINILAPTEFEYSQSPFNKRDSLLILVRDNFYGENGLVITYGKYNTDYHYGSYFDDKTVSDLYKKLKVIQPKYICIVKEQNQNTKAIRKFIKEVKEICKNTEIEIKNNNGKYKMFS